MDLLLFREATEGDINFIFASWLKSYRNSPDAARIRTRVYYLHQHPRIEQILLRSKTIVASTKDDPNHIVGYIVIEKPNTLHYIYVKQIYRNLGIAKQLLSQILDHPPDVLTYTHSTAAARHILKYFKETSFVPFVTTVQIERMKHDPTQIH